MTTFFVLFIIQTMAKQIKKFKSALERSRCDPSGVFLNDKLKGIFFPEKQIFDENANNHTKTCESRNGTQQKKTGIPEQQSPKKSSTCSLL